MEQLSKDLVIPVELLGLSDVEITSSKLSRNDEIILCVKSTKSEIACHRCGKPTRPHGKGQPLRLRHLPILGKRTIIVFTPPRGRCEHCDKNPTTTQTLSWHDRNAHHTHAYEEHLLFSLVHSTLADVEMKEGIHAGVIQHLVDKRINNQVDWKSIQSIGLLGIDEISLKKGYQDYLTIVTSKVNNKLSILSVLRGREKSMIKGFFSSIPKKKQKTITAVCCDLYVGYMNAAKEVFSYEVPIVTDRFHVAKLYSGCLVELRKRELKRLRSELSTEDYQSLKPAIRILVKCQELYNEKEKKQLQPLFKLSSSLKAAYRLARQLTGIFNRKHRKPKAVKEITQWIDGVSQSEVTAFDGFINTLSTHLDTITNYFISRHSSGFVEGFNNKLKVIKRRCYGIYNIKHFFQRIFLDLEGYRLFYKNQSITNFS